jgi:catechol 2,3-dioxygenase-like lactoylglutathione lyase family enzyme
MSGALRFRWGHININVADLERSVRFYEKLGFEAFLPEIPYLGAVEGEVRPLAAGAIEALGLASSTRARACIMQLGPDGGFPKIDLTELSSASPDPRCDPLANGDLGLVRFCLLTRDLNTVYERLRADGVEFPRPPQAGKDGMATIAICKDPDGTLIELLEIHPDRWPKPSS